VRVPNRLPPWAQGREGDAASPRAVRSCWRGAGPAATHPSSSGLTPPHHHPNSRNKLGGMLAPLRVERFPLCLVAGRALTCPPYCTFPSRRSVYTPSLPTESSASCELTRVHPVGSVHFDVLTRTGEVHFCSVPLNIERCHTPTLRVITHELTTRAV